MAYSKGALFAAAIAIVFVPALVHGKANSESFPGMWNILSTLGTRGYQNAAASAAEAEGIGAREGETLSSTRYSSSDQNDGNTAIEESFQKEGVVLEDQLLDFSSWNICPDSKFLSADVTHMSGNRSPLLLANRTHAGHIAELKREVIHGRQCLLSTLNAYSHSEKKYANLVKSYEALLSEKENLEEQLRKNQRGRVEGILVWTLIICGVAYFLERTKLGAVHTFLSRARGHSQPQHRPLTSEQVSRHLDLLWGEGNNKYPGSGALFVESGSDPSQFYLLVPVNLGAGRPFALFGTGGDYESDLEKAEAYVAGRDPGRLSIILYKHGGGLFNAQELERVERVYGNIFSVVGRTTGVQLLLLVAHEMLSGYCLRVWDSAGDSELETRLVTREAWELSFLRGYH